MIKIISIVLSVIFVAGCSTVAGVGQEELTDEDLDRIEKELEGDI